MAVGSVNGDSRKTNGMSMRAYRSLVERRDSRRTYEASMPWVMPVAKIASRVA